MVMLQSALGVPMPDVIAQSIRDFQEKKEEQLRKEYLTYERYYRGDHKTSLTNRLKKFLLNNELVFRDNFCEPVVDALAERLNIIGVDSTDDDLNTWAWDLWQANRMDATQAIVHTDTVMKGDSYVLVSWDEANSRPRFDFQDANLIIPHYDPTTRMVDWASKKWGWIKDVGQAPVARLNLYYANRVEKYILDGANWKQFQEDGDATWPLPWVDKDKKPLGVALVHFRNRPLADDFGISELANVIPMQDLLNKMLIDLVQILDTQAFAQKWTIGVNKPASGYSITPGAVWNMKATNPNSTIAKVGQFDAADVKGALDSIEMVIQHIAGRSRTPQHLFHITGGFPSGEALKAAESGLVSKVKQRQVTFGNAWEDCLNLAFRVQGAFGEAPPGAPDTMLEMVWDDPETRNENEHLDSLTKKMALGITQHQIWREMGYSQEQIEQMETDKKEQKVADSNIGAEILKAFNAGEDV